MDQQTNQKPRLSRRQMLRGLGGSATAALILAACGSISTGGAAPTAPPAALAAGG